MAGVAVVSALTAVTAGQATAGVARAAGMAIPPSANQLIVVSSPTDDPPDYLATLRVYERANRASPWRLVFGPWQAETGSGHLLSAGARREGDHATPVGVFGIAGTMYGNEPNPGGLHYAYHRLGCGDWWDEDPHSPQYNRFVHVPCGVTPSFSSWSEPLWTETVAYPYFAVIRFNVDPTRRRECVGFGDLPPQLGSARPRGAWRCASRSFWNFFAARPSTHPVIEIGTEGQVRAPATGQTAACRLPHRHRLGTSMSRWRRCGRVRPRPARSTGRRWGTRSTWAPGAVF